MSGLEPIVTVGEPAKSQATASPSPLVQGDPNRIEYEIDGRGRKLGIKKLTALDMFELTILLDQHSGNMAALNQALAASSVVSIDGERLGRPVTVLDLKARIQRLDFDGYAAAGKALERFAPAGSDLPRDAIKN